MPLKNENNKIFYTLPTMSDSDPMLRFHGPGTFRLKRTFRELAFDWNKEAKFWYLSCEVPCSMITNSDLKASVMPTIDDITISASLEGIQVIQCEDNITNHIPFTYDIKNTNKTYPDGTKMDGRPKSVITNGHRTIRDVISVHSKQTGTEHRLDLRGSTYHNRDFLKTSFHARFDLQQRVWYINIDDHNWTLERVCKVLNEFGILDHTIHRTYKTQSNNVKQREERRQRDRDKRRGRDRNRNNKCRSRSRSRSR
eukprot:6342_1